MTSAIGIALVVALAAVLLLARAWARRAVVADRASRPRELMDAELVYMEKRFRIHRPFPLVARVDRAYRLPGGSLVLVELKTRQQDRAYLSDVIQLSAQRLAIELQTGAVVEPYAFVSVLGPNRRLRSHCVNLLEAPTLVVLHRRRESILLGQVEPAHSASTSECRGCALRTSCDRFRAGDVRT
jgi:CRISPR/Cas system-associated exonuclease Cas4 (RecB family)